jgi:hypothetical protein
MGPSTPARGVDSAPPAAEGSGHPDPVRTGCTATGPLRLRPRRTWLVAAIVVAVAVVIATVLLVAAVPFVTVTEIDFTSVDNACGANGSNVSGFTVRATSTAFVNVTVVNSGSALPCTISSLRATTAGFSLSGANLPLRVSPNGSAPLSFTVHVPSSGYMGNLNVDVE